MAVPLLESVLKGLNQRFEGYDHKDDFIIASVTLPQFWLRWLEDDDKKSHARTILYEQVRAIQQQQQQQEGQHKTETQLSESDDDFFSFGTQAQTRTDTVEVDLYLGDISREIESLAKISRYIKIISKIQYPSSI